ncbi:hypothetical protein EDEG_03062 [Edhazardia aedis USNM 41457]|uniref:Uncharacterized protein n=1 Tax=Edhazardia aedis (strain USNM 41457) TaxID=1003232 RepID=J8ZS55_EDHAE|nr:hypothetical protein EDEG_03062 [Edhazardia aedis USNM 41457]|eukprot:EJW02523.1 hypothetical protein EDEG_03062 [Edhazardia aedis USNM 41457]
MLLITIKAMQKNNYLLKNCIFNNLDEEKNILKLHEHIKNTSCDGIGIAVVNSNEKVKNVKFHKNNETKSDLYHNCCGTNIETDGKIIINEIYKHLLAIHNNQKLKSIIENLLIKILNRYSLDLHEICKYIIYFIDEEKHYAIDLNELTFSSCLQLSSDVSRFMLYSIQNKADVSAIEKKCKNDPDFRKNATIYIKTQEIFSTTILIFAIILEIHFDTVFSETLKVKNIDIPLLLDIIHIDKILNFKNVNLKNSLFVYSIHVDFNLKLFYFSITKNSNLKFYSCKLFNGDGFSQKEIFTIYFLRKCYLVLKRLSFVACEKIFDLICRLNSIFNEISYTKKNFENHLLSTGIQNKIDTKTLQSYESPNNVKLAADFCNDIFSHTESNAKSYKESHKTGSFAENSFSNETKTTLTTAKSENLQKNGFETDKCIINKNKNKYLHTLSIKERYDNQESDKKTFFENTRNLENDVKEILYNEICDIPFLFFLLDNDIDFGLLEPKHLILIKNTTEIVNREAKNHGMCTCFNKFIKKYFRKLLKHNIIVDYEYYHTLFSIKQDTNNVKRIDSINLSNKKYSKEFDSNIISKKPIGESLKVENYKGLLAECTKNVFPNLNAIKCAEKSQTEKITFDVISNNIIEDLTNMKAANDEKRKFSVCTGNLKKNIIPKINEKNKSTENKKIKSLRSKMHIIDDFSMFNSDELLSVIKKHIDETFNINNLVALFDKMKIWSKELVLTSEIKEFIAENLEKTQKTIHKIKLILLIHKDIPNYKDLLNKYIENVPQNQLTKLFSKSNIIYAKSLFFRDDKYSLSNKDSLIKKFYCESESHLNILNDCIAKIESINLIFVGKFLKLLFSNKIYDTSYLAENSNSLLDKLLNKRLSLQSFDNTPEKLFMKQNVNHTKSIFVFKSTGINENQIGNHLSHVNSQASRVYVKNDINNARKILITILSFYVKRFLYQNDFLHDAELSLARDILNMSYMFMKIYGKSKEIYTKCEDIIILLNNYSNCFDLNIVFKNIKNIY